LNTDGEGEDGESFVNANGVFIHFSGHFPGSNYIIEIIDLDNNCAATDITETGEFNEELIAAAYCSDIDTIFLGEEHSSPSYNDLSRGWNQLRFSR